MTRHAQHAPQYPQNSNEHSTQHNTSHTTQTPLTRTQASTTALLIQSTFFPPIFGEFEKRVAHTQAAELFPGLLCKHFLGACKKEKKHGRVCDACFVRAFCVLCACFRRDVRVPACMGARAPARRRCAHAVGCVHPRGACAAARADPRCPPAMCRVRARRCARRTTRPTCSSSSSPSTSTWRI